MPFPAFEYQAFSCYMEATTEVFASGVGAGPSTAQHNCIHGASPPTWPDIQMFTRGESNILGDLPKWWEVAQGSVLLLGSGGTGGPFCYNVAPNEQRVSGDIIRYGWPVPLKIRWEEVITDFFTRAELSRTPVEYAIGPGATSVPFTLTVGAADTQTNIENVQLVTPVMASY